VTKDVRYSACSPVKGPSFLHTAGVNDGWLFDQRGSTVRVSRTATPCMVHPPVVRYSPMRSGQHGVHGHTPNTKSSHHHGVPIEPHAEHRWLVWYASTFSTRILARSALYVMNCWSWWKCHEWTPDHELFSRMPLRSCIRMTGFSNCSTNVMRRRESLWFKSLIRRCSHGCVREAQPASDSESRRE